MHSKSKRTKEDYDYDGKKCMAKFYCLHERVLKCMDSKEGNYLLHRAGRETDSLQPKKTRIPWILVDGKHDEEVSQLISADFVGWACQNYEGDERIKDCRKFLF
jgi:hypothetical protein